MAANISKPVGKPAGLPNPMGRMPNQMNNSMGMNLYGRSISPSMQPPQAQANPMALGAPPMPKGPTNPVAQQAVSMNPDEQAKAGMNRPYTLSEIMNMPWDQWNALRQKFGVFDG